jgi:hypothetical protein
MWRVVYVLKAGSRGRFKVHELHCPWLNGPKGACDWSKYRIVSARAVKGAPHARCCLARAATEATETKLP